MEDSTQETKTKPRHFVVMLGSHMVLAVRDTAEAAAEYAAKYLAANVYTQSYEMGNRPLEVHILASLERASEPVLGHGKTAHVSAEVLGA